MSNQNRKFQTGFLLNMRMIADVLEEEYAQLRFYIGDDRCCLKGVRFNRPPQIVNTDYVYVLKARDVDKQLLSGEGRFVILGEFESEWITSDCSVIQVLDSVDMLDVMELVHQVFEKYRQWDAAIQRALNSAHPLDEMLIASMEVLRNPMIIHDTNSYILSSPRHVSGMLKWEMDARTGRKMVPLALINDFKVDMEYLETLNKKEPTIFSANQRGYRILFVNLWNEGRYEGRILMDEIQSSIRPGDFYVMKYLGEWIEHCIRQRRLMWLGMGDDIDHFLTGLLDNKITDEHLASGYLQYMNWKRHDRYVCLKVVTDQEDFNAVSASVTLSNIEAQITGGHAFQYDGSIVVMVNLSYENLTIDTVLSNLAIILREGLLKIGVSTEVTDIFLLPIAYKQAAIALDFGRISESTYWCYSFNDYMLDYMVEVSSREIPIQMMCAEPIRWLREYDEKNHTELYQTLKLYLRAERNVLQTSKELYIHRSTLFYRLERIRKITGLELDRPEERLKLLISFYMLDRES